VATNFTVKIGEIGLLTFIRRPEIPKWSGISQFDFKRFNGDDLATLFKSLVNFGSVTPELERDKCVHPPRRSAV